MLESCKRNKHGRILVASSASQVRPNFNPMSESLFKRFMLFMYAVILGIFGFIIFKAPDEWREAVCIVVVATPVYFWIVRLVCNTSRRYGGFSPAADAPGEHVKNDTSSSAPLQSKTTVLLP